MTTKLKKLLTSLLAFSLVLGMLPMGTMASAANITGDNVDIEEYHILKGDTIAKLEEAAKKLNPNLIVTDESLYQIHIIFQHAPLVTLFPLHGVTDYWHGLVDLVHKKNQQPDKILSIEMGYGSDLNPHFLTISADYLNIQCFKKFGNDIAQISLNESAVSPDPTPVEHKFAVNYLFTDGKKPANGFVNYENNLEAGALFAAVAIDAPQGYTRTVDVVGADTSTTIEGIMPEGDVTVTFTYTPIPKPRHLTFQYVTPAVVNVSVAPEGIHVPDPIPAGDGTGNGYKYKFAEVGFHSKSDSAAIPDGYAFKGWFLEETCKTQVKDGNIVSYDDTLYGYWTKTPDPIKPAETFAFSVSYVFSDGSRHEGFGTRTKQLEVDADYSAEVLAAPEGYHQLDRFDITGATLLTGKMPANDVSVTFYYALDEPIVTPPVEPPVTPPVEPPVTPPSPSYSYYRATVRYLALDTNAVLADAYSTDTIREGRSYDVSAQAALAISGYTIDHVEGATSGTLNGNVTVTVWYSAETVLENPDVPLVDVPEVPPTTPPAPDASGETDEVILVDPETPLGDLPQTGIVAEAADPASTLGFAALAASMAMAGLAVALNRKREDAE